MSGSSPAEDTELPTAADAVADTGVSAAASPDAEGVNGAADTPEEKPFDALAVTRAALKDAAPKEPAGEGDAPSPIEGKDEKADAKADDASKASDADDANLPFGKHPRWKAVLSERNEARQKAAEYEPDARSYRQVLGFMEQSNLKAEEVQEGFAIMAALKNTPEKALEMLRPHYERLQALVGERLPDDLREKIEDGRLDEVTARELAQTRGRATLMEQGVRERAEREAQAREAAEANARANAAESYIAGKRTTDPDFAVKEPLLRGAIREALDDAIAAGRSPRTPDDVTRIMETAYSKLTSHLRTLNPQRNRPVSRPVPSGMSSTPATAAPKNALEVTRMALMQGR